MVKICPVCGKKFVAQTARKIYCSRECNAKNYFNAHRRTETLPPRKCEWCGEEYQPRRKDQKFCSPTCLEDATNLRHKIMQRETRARNEKRICPVCSKEFVVKYPAQKCCSAQCRSLMPPREYRVLKERQCLQCGVTFKPHHSEQKYCSRECYNETLGKEAAQVCPTCGKEFYPEHPNQVHCSLRCKFGLTDELVGLIRIRLATLRRQRRL